MLLRLNDFLKSKGYETNDIEVMMPYIRTWKSWYENKVPSFQNYYIFNGEKNVKQKRYTLGMGKKIPEDYSNLLLNEKATFKVGENEENNAFNKILDENDFYDLANSGIERTFATGTGAFVLSLGNINYDEKNETFSFDNANLVIEFVSAEKIKPLTYNRKKVTECAFGVERVINGKKYLYVTMHKKNNIGNYVIQNYLFQVDRGDNLIDVSDKIDNTFLEFDTESPNPWFSILRPGIENNISEDSPFGMAIYANSIDLLKGTDLTYDSFCNEFIHGKKRVMVRMEAVKADVIDGTIKRSYDPNDVVFYVLPESDYKNGEVVKEIDMKLRIAEHEEGVQLALNLLSENVGLGTGYYKFEKNKVATATEVISENSALFRSIRKHEIRIENCLYDLFKTICYIAGHFLHLPLNEDMEISIDFDDSIFEDKKEIKATAMLELNNDLINPIQYYMKVYKMTESQAKKYYKKVKAGLEEKKQEDDEPGEE